MKYPEKPDTPVYLRKEVILIGIALITVLGTPFAVAGDTNNHAQATIEYGLSNSQALFDQKMSVVQEDVLFQNSANVARLLEEKSDRALRDIELALESERLQLEALDDEINLYVPPSTFSKNANATFAGKSADE